MLSLRDHLNCGALAALILGSAAVAWAEEGFKRISGAVKPRYLLSVANP